MNQVALLKDRLTWQRRNSVSSRLLSILKRYGVGDQRMVMAIFHYLKMVAKYGAVPTFPITAQVVARHADTIRKFQDRGAEFAIHGYSHVDYTMLSRRGAGEQLSKAIEVFHKNGINYSGFRFPYLKRDPELFGLFSTLGFAWDSSDTVDFDSVQPDNFPEKTWQSYDFMRRDYGKKFMVTQTALPKMKDDVLEIPVALPDDDLLVDRLLIDDVSFIAACWKRMLVRNYEKGEIFVLQLHPERFFICESALEVLLEVAFRAKSKIWLASLNEVNKWWRERNGFFAAVQKISKSRFSVKIFCTERSTLLIKNGENLNNGEPLIENYYPINTKSFEMECNVKPVIGVPNDFPKHLSDYLHEQGFVFEIVKPQSKYAVNLAQESNNNSLNIPALDESIRQSTHPLLRFWRWPNQARCALSITGDIDCLTHLDFYTRLWELSS